MRLFLFKLRERRSAFHGTCQKYADILTDHGRYGRHLSALRLDSRMQTNTLKIDKLSPISLARVSTLLW